MKKKIGLLLAVIMAMTMVMGIGVTAFAEPYTTDSPYGTVVWNDACWSMGAHFIYIGDNNYLYFGDGEYFGVYTAVGDTLDVGGYTTKVPSEPSPNAIYKSVNSGGQDTLVPNTCSCTFTPKSPAIASGNSAHTHNFTWQTITEPTLYSDGLAGDVCSICGFAKNTQPVSSYGYAINGYATKLVNESKSGQVIKLDFGEFNSFPKAFMEKVAAKSAQNVTFIFTYKWNHVKQEIKIPAFSNVDTSLDWYGPATMQQLYGAN